MVTCAGTPCHRSSTSLVPHQLSGHTSANRCRPQPNPASSQSYCYLLHSTRLQPLPLRGITCHPDEPHNDAGTLNNQTGLSILSAGGAASETVHLTNRYCINNPAMLQGSRCFIDASTTPDHLNPQTRTAGLGIFILNLQEQPSQSIFIKARLSVCTSVLVAEAASLAFAASIVQALNITNCTYLSDCQQLVHFLNMEDSSNPPYWRIKPFTQLFHNISSSQASRIYKISRSQNTTADALARQALSSQITQLQISCTNRACDNQCSVLQALHLVGLSDVTVLTAVCC